jgi:hypothetical protein
MSLESRLNAKLDKSGDCWVFTGAKSQGYGLIWAGRTGKPSDVGYYNQRSLTPAHRAAYELWVGPIPEGMVICHKCDNPPCCNPDHLFLGTYVENMQDCSKKGRTGNRFKSRQS